ncbi:hypothetical protein [Sphingomonas sp. MA1305]|uniref:hypothetical protein n=1 Tax=Sphingomonas sp. MA1305 TaxID=2479204 RepID=UPI0018DF5C3B|nr:hypothetical protein [Sphingomonas sp. MA1305]
MVFDTLTPIEKALVVSARQADPSYRAVILASAEWTDTCGTALTQIESNAQPGATPAED